MRQFLWSFWIIRSVFLLLWVLLFAAIFLFARQSWFSNERSITVLSWSVMFDHDRIAEFEKKTGIRVYLNHYESNEELLVKLRAAQGAGFDLVAPSDYAIEKLVSEGLLKKLDRTKMPFFQTINPNLLGHYFDPKNEYSVPYIWSIYCIAYNNENIDPSQVSSYWDLIFTRYQNQPWYKIVMSNDPLEAIVFATIFLHGLPLGLLDTERSIVVKDLLTRQKSWVEQYGNLRGDFALSTESAYAVIMHSGDALRAARKDSRISYVVPRPAVVTIEHCAIPAQSNKEDLVYEFLDFMFEPESFIRSFPKAFDFPARNDLDDLLGLRSHEAAVLHVWDDPLFSFSFIRDLISERARFDLWLAVKS